MKIINKKTILILVAFLILVILIYAIFFNKKENGLKLEKVVRGTVIQEISETGTIEPADKINLGFKTAGRIDKINVKVGDTVKKGDELASLDKIQLFIQLNQAQASLAVAQAQYNKLLAGYTPEEIKVSETARDAAQDDLNGAYQDALNTLDDAYLKIYNTYNAVISLQNSYFSTAVQEGIKVQDNKTIISNSLNAVKPFLNTAKTSIDHNDIDSAISQMITSLNNTSDALKIIRDMCDQGIYYSKVSSTDKTNLDNHRSYIITALTNVTNSQQTISSDKIALQKAEDELALKTAKPRQEDVDYYRAKVREASANVDSLQQQIWETTLRAPVAGTITKVDKKMGETVQTTELPISLISLDPLQIKADIYEEDIVKIQVGNPVDIKIAAFPSETLTGKVVSIDPAEKLVEGVVYYEVTIAFDEPKQGIKSGMTVDIVIKTAVKENVLLVSKEAVREKEKTTVQVYKDGVIEEREIQIGLKGNDNKVEVLSGLSEGEEVVIK